VRSEGSWDDKTEDRVAEEAQDTEFKKVTALSADFTAHLNKAVEDAKDALDRQGISMIEALKHEGRTSLITEGFTISVDITPAREKLKCKKLEQK